MDSGGIPSLLMQAAQSAAHADGVSSDGQGSPMDSLQLMQQAQMMQQRKAEAPPTQQRSQPAPSQNTGPAPTKKKGTALRRGKWTPEEEAYANRLIQEFKAGLLPLTDGTTLRTFLSKLLNCDPMRISKKFVGSNCIGKQVFRRRTADLNRLTPEQIQKSRSELSELERRFLERVAQTNRVKSSGVRGGVPPAGAGPTGTDGLQAVDMEGNASGDGSASWLQPSLGMHQSGGAGLAAAAAGLGGGAANSRAAAAGRALLEGYQSNSRKSGSQDNAGLLAMAELQRRASQSSLLQNMSNPSAQNILAAAAGSQGSSMAQMARNASAAHMAGLPVGGNNSINNLMLKTGFSRDQLSQLARERGLSSASLTNMVERKNSFDALMGLDYQGLQSIDNLANLIQSGSGSGGMGGSNVPSSGMKNWSADSGRNGGGGSNNDSLSNAARRLASVGNMESLFRNFSSGNVNSGGNNSGSGNTEGGQANADLQNLLQNINNGNNVSSLLGGSSNAGGAASLANLLRDNNSSTGLALRMQDGLGQGKSSVEDFLSLVAAGDVPQEGSLLNVPWMQQNSGQGNNSGGNNDTATMLAQQQLLAQATGNPSLANSIASRSFGNVGLGNSGNSDNATTAALKRKLLELDGGTSDQGSSKR